MSMFEIHGGFTGLAASSRVRLARNLKGYPFRLTDAQHQEIADKVFATLQNNPTIGPEFEKKQIIPRSTEASQLVEEHLISPELAQNGGWLIVSKDGGVSIMVGEEDHLRLQVIGSGLCPKECLETANRIAALIESALPFAYDERLGYLTACPTNVGTGLRASIMLHLPLLTATGEINQMVGYAGSRGCAVRGAYGEGSKAVGGFYQISNQVTLGASAAELTDKLVEAHLISPELAQNGGWLIVSKDGGVSIMVGEEDHLRLQVIGTGLCPKECLETANRIAALIEAALPFAYDERLGYLTACPTNIGTGLRASIMLHLPMLTATDGMGRMAGYAGSRGCAVRGAYGEGSKAVGGFYQISNQVTLGASAAELTDKLVETATAIIDAEKKAREQVRSQNEAGLRDRIYRAAGTLRSAYLIETAEAVQCISDVLVGLQMGMLSGIDPQALYQLEQRIRPAMLTGAPQERDIKRAAMLREAAQNIRFA